MPPCASRSLRSVFGLALSVAALALAAPLRADDEPPSLSRALFMEKTARDCKGALAIFERIAADVVTDASPRAEARLGAARCLVALGRGGEAEALWRAIEQDPAAPTAAKDEARSRRDERARAASSARDAEADARAAEAIRRTEQARLEREGRVEAARVLVLSATAHVRAKRYERAREDLIQALQLNPADERAAALLDEVSAFGDRGELLRQAIRFVATNRTVDFRRLSGDVERARKAALRSIREGRADAAVASLRDAIERIDASDFYAELVAPRRELEVLLKKAADDAKAAGLVVPPDAAVAPDRPTTPVKPWRSEFFALLSRVFTSGAAPETSLRFYDAPVPPNPAPESREFAAKGLRSSPEAGTLRRARWIERYVRQNVAPGSWSGADRLLERYDDQIVVEHAASVLREVDAVVAQLADGPPAPMRVEVRVYAAAPGGVADAVRALEVRSRAGEPGTDLVVSAPVLERQERLLSVSKALLPIAQASLRMTGRHATLVRFHEPTSACAWCAQSTDAPVVVPAKDATYGLDLDLYVEDLPGAKGYAAISAVATVKRPERTRLVALANGNTRVPSFSIQQVEADRKVPHAGSLALLTLANPFKDTGAAGDAAGGTHPDLVVLIAAWPVANAQAPDAPAPTSAPSGDRVTREIELGPIGEIDDEPPPDEWPSTPFADRSRADAARRRRDAFLAGLLAERMGVAPLAAALSVRDGRATATLLPDDHDRLLHEVARLSADASRLFTVEVRASEVAAVRFRAILADAGVRADDRDQRLWRLEDAVAARLDERLASAPGGGVFDLETRLAARHTQLVTARSLRSRSIVEEFRVEPDGRGGLRTTPVNGTAEEGLVVSVRPVSDVGGLATLDVSAVVARIAKVDAWTPSDVPGGAPSVSLPRHEVERAAGQGTFGEKDAILLAVPSPGSDGTRVVLVRVRRHRS